MTTEQKQMFANVLGEVIREYRDSRGISQPKLAKKMGMSFKSIYRYENGVNAIPLVVLKMIADALGVRVTEIYKEANSRYISLIK